MAGCSSTPTPSRGGDGGNTSVGTSGSTGTGAGPTIGLGGSGPINLPGGNGTAPPDDDPTNPNIAHPLCGMGTCADFPDSPLMGDGVPTNAPTLFGDATNFDPGALCVLEPQLSAGSAPGTMIPANWLRPRIKFNAPSNLDLFEVRIHTPAEKNDFIAYTKKTTYYLPKEIWAGAPPAAGAVTIAAGSGVANNAGGNPLTVTVRGVNSASPGKPVGVSGDFEVAPVVATGSMVFWTVNSAVVTPDSSKLLGFAIGDEGVGQALGLTNLTWTGAIGEDGSVLRGYYDMPKLAGFVDGQVRCIGCHTSTPDGTAVAFTDDWPWDKVLASVAAGTTGQIPTYVTAGAQALLKMPWMGTQTMSKGLWATGDRTLITSYGTTFKSGTARTKAWQGLPSYDSANPANDDKIKWHQLAWFNLATTAVVNGAVTDTPDYGNALNDRETAAANARGTGWGLIATGDTGVSDVSPNISHAGDKIVYTTTDYSPDGHPDYTAKTASVKVVPYNNRAGGTSTAVAGASDPSKLNYYPSFSADDKWIAFTQAPVPGASSPDGPYYNRFGQVMVVPAAGGTATQLVANTPNTCAGDNVSAGIINSWPKWSPDAFVAHGKTYYFVIFSSARKYGDEFSTQFNLPMSSSSAFAGLNTSSQLWLSAVVVDNASGAVTTYPALYIWNQNRLASAGGGAGTSISFSNLTPAWDPFQLPPITIDQVPTDVR